MKYDDIATLRSAILEEIREQFYGLPITVEHYKLCEMHVQTIIMLLNKNTLRDEIVKVADDIEKSNDKSKDDRTKKHG